MGCGESKAPACEAPETAELPAEVAAGATEDGGARGDEASAEGGACADKALAVSPASSNESTAWDEKSNDTAAVRELCLDSQDGEGVVDPVSAAIAEADRLLHSHQALRAEEVLARALVCLDDEAASVLRASATYAAVCALCRRYDDIADMLKAQDGHLRLMWEDEGGQLWLHKPADETWLEFRVITDIDAPLSHCLACCNEVSLIPEFEPNVLETPAFLGEPDAYTSVVRTVLGVLLLRLELITETRRFYNTEHGFVAESIRSDFPVEGRPVPPRHWRYKRMRIRTSNLWIPQGGGRGGTTVVQSSRADAGFRIPDFVVEFFCRKLAPSMVGNMRKNAMSVGNSDGPYAPRLAEDSQGVYAECAKVEEAASRRRSCSAGSLPSQDWFRRPWRLAAP